MSMKTVQQQYRRVKVSEIKPHPKNPRVGDLEAIGGSIDKSGFYGAVVVQKSTGLILAGNHRYKAALERGAKTLPVLYVDVDDATALRILAADNGTSDKATNDDERLLSLLKEIGQETGSIEGTGYDAGDFKDLERRLVHFMASESVEPPVPPPPKKAKSKLGEVYELGPHRLMCGDARDAKAVEILTQGLVFSSVVTDPPYGIERGGVANDDPAGLRALFDAVLAVAPLQDAVVAAFQSPRLVVEWIDAVRNADHRFERMLWLYRQTVISTYPWRGWLMCGDAIVLSSVGRPKWPSAFDYTHDTYVKTGAEDSDLTGKHPTVKPAWVVRDLIAKLPDGTVYEPFAGSGTTLVACEQIGRRCFAMEVDAIYCDVIRQRYADLVERPDLAP